MNPYVISDSTQSHRNRQPPPWSLVTLFSNRETLDTHFLPPSHPIVHFQDMCGGVSADLNTCGKELSTGGWMVLTDTPLCFCPANSTQFSYLGQHLPLPRHTLSEISCACHIIRFLSQSEFHSDSPRLPKLFFRNWAYIKLSLPWTFHAFWQVQIGIDWFVQLQNLWEKRTTASAQSVLNLRHMGEAWKPPKSNSSSVTGKISQITCRIWHVLLAPS